LQTSRLTTTTSCMRSPTKRRQRPRVEIRQPQLRLMGKENGID
jgi:hypothetical protein